MKISKKINVLIADKVNLLHLHKLRKSKFNVTLRYGMTNDEILSFSRLKNFQVLFVKSQRCLDKVFLARCNFEVICTASKGLDHIDIDYAFKRGISVVFSDSGNSVSAAEHTLGLILTGFKRINYADGLVRTGNFTDWGYERRTLEGKRIGVIGTGKVGFLVARYAKAFGMEVIANDTDRDVRRRNRDLKYYSLDFLLRNSDVISVHIPLEKRNLNFIDGTAFDKMKSNVIFVNTSRGEVVDEEYLIRKARLNKKIFIALDVFKDEPNLNPDLFSLRNAVFTNHVAGKTPEGEQGIGNDLFMQVNNIFY
ncbi:MAG: NAD(P)-dependent oxidoreductase [Ignavibacteria bacterium]